MEKYEKNGKVAILYSPGFGAGWSTWNYPELAYDKRVVEFFIKHKESKKFMTEKDLEEAFEEMGYENVYFGGYDDIKIKWVPRGQKFIIDEYDGSECVQYPEDFKWEIA